LKKTEDVIMKKKLILMLTVATMLFGATACGKTQTGTDSNDTEVTSEALNAESATEETTLSEEEQAELDALYQPATEFPQLEGVKVGDTIATIHTSKGDIKVWFFPDYAPKAVENFVTHAKEGYYDGVSFHRVIENFMIQSGDPTGTGAGGESIWGEPFGVERSFELRHFRGALCMAKTSAEISIGSQFYIVQNNGLDDSTKSQLEQIKGQLDQVFYEDGDKKLTIGETYFPETVIDEYLKNGGTPALDMQYTVFGQVYEGMDVVDAIAAVEKTTGSDGAESKPVEDVIISSIDVGTYQG
jgi:cyclophilin family peptidyl-prolyl cis-trans isomerase